MSMDDDEAIIRHQLKSRDLGYHCLSESKWTNGFQVRIRRYETPGRTEE